MSGSVYVQPLAASSKLQVIHRVWLFPPSLAAHRRGQEVLQSELLSALVRAVGKQISQVTAGSDTACLCLLACCHSQTNHRLIFWWNWWKGLLYLPWEVSFKIREVGVPAKMEAQIETFCFLTQPKHNLITINNLKTMNNQKYQKIKLHGTPKQRS